MAIDEVRVFLEGARDSALRYAELKERVARLDATARRVTANLSPTAGVSGGGGSQKDSLLIRLADERERLNALIGEELERQKEIGAFIERIDCTDVQKTILRRRYIHYDSWIRILHWLAEHNIYYSEAHLYRLHAEALDAARKLFEEEKGGEHDADG